MLASDLRLAATYSALYFLTSLGAGGQTAIALFVTSTGVKEALMEAVQ